MRRSPLNGERIKIDKKKSVQAWYSKMAKRGRRIILGE